MSAVGGGVPLWGFYRSGGIVKIRLNTNMPTLNLIGSSTISIAYGEMYTDPGVVASSIIDGQIIPNLVSINDNNNINYLLKSIKFIEKPHFDIIIDQIQVVKKNINSIINKVGYVDLKFTE